MKKLYIDDGKESSALQKDFIEMSDDSSNYSKTNTFLSLSLGSIVTLIWSGLFRIIKDR